MFEKLFWIVVVIAPITFVAWATYGTNVAFKIAILFGLPLILYATTKEEIAAMLLFGIILWVLEKSER